MLAIRATVYTTTHHSPVQLVFGRDSILNTRHEADWQLIRSRKQTLINKGNECETRNRLPHEYNVGDMILLKNAWKIIFNQEAYLGLYTIIAVRKNATVRDIKCKVTDTLYLCNIAPYDK